MLKLSVLDHTPVDHGKTAYDAMRETIELAQTTDKLGFYRFWVSEHHNSKALAGSSPEILISSIAANTSRIRVGSGGVLLSHYSPYKVAENFRVLESLYPTRIDLGIGRALGADNYVVDVIQDNGLRSRDNYPHQVDLLIQYLNGKDPSNSGVFATPLGDTTPDIWILGTSEKSATLAASIGMPFMYAQFIGGYNEDIIKKYKNHFKSSDYHTRPISGVALYAICGDTTAQALKLATKFDPSFLKKKMILGDPKHVKKQLENLAIDLGVDEIMINTLTGDIESRLKSYKLIAESFSLS